MAIEETTAYATETDICHAEHIHVERTNKLKEDWYGIGPHAETVSRYVRSHFPQASDTIHSPVILNNQVFICYAAARCRKFMGLSRFDLPELCLHYPRDTKRTWHICARSLRPIVYTQTYWLSWCVIRLRLLFPYYASNLLQAPTRDHAHKSSETNVIISRNARTKAYMVSTKLERKGATGEPQQQITEPLLFQSWIPLPG